MAKDLQGGATFATEYADQGPDQKGLMARRSDGPDPASFTQWTDELPKAEQERRAKAAKSGNPVENYAKQGRYKCKNVDRCGFSTIDPAKREGHEPGCDKEMARRNAIEAKEKADWEAAHPGEAFPGASEPILTSNATATKVEVEPIVVSFPAQEQYVTKEELNATLSVKFGELMGDIRSLLLGGKKTGEGETHEGSRANQGPSLEDGSKSVPQVGRDAGEVLGSPQGPDPA
jgi:hypothetical protein